eukprot:c20163_g1_i2 orf=133-924(-)
MENSTSTLVKRTGNPSSVIFSGAKELGCSRALSGNSCRKDPTTEDAITQQLHRCDSNNGSVLRACSHCGTAKTPLWRTGPQGPKSLCNACGIKFKKSRKCLGGTDHGMELRGSHPAPPISNNISTGSFKRKQDRVTSLNFCVSLDEDHPRNHHKRIEWQQGLSWNRSWQQGEDVTGSSSESCLTWNPHYLSSPSSRGGVSMNSPESSSPSSKRVPLPTPDDQQDAQNHHNNSIGRACDKDDEEEEEAAVLLMALSLRLKQSSR